MASKLTLSGFLNLSRSHLATLTGSVSDVGKVKHLKFQKVTFVLGNETCDLDSAVCSIVYAYFLSVQLLERGVEDHLVCPVFNIHEKDIPLKKDVLQCFQEYDLCVEDVVCINQLEFDQLLLNIEVRVVLVDHHTTHHHIALEDHVVEVIDHRQCDREEMDGVRILVKLVGSCASLVSQRIWEIDETFSELTCMLLLRDAIITDTVNFSEKAKKFTPDDVKAMEIVEAKLRLMTNNALTDRASRYCMILKAKTETHNLTTCQCLRKDLKIIRGNGSKGIAFSAHMPSARTLIERKDFIADADTFLGEFKCQVLVVMGVVIDMAEDSLKENVDIAVYPCKVDNVVPQRDIAIYPCRRDGDGLAQLITTELLKREELKLKWSECRVEGVKLYHLGDPTYSRKKILPIVKTILGFNNG